MGNVHKTEHELFIPTSFCQVHLQETPALWQRRQAKSSALILHLISIGKHWRLQGPHHTSIQLLAQNRRPTQELWCAQCMYVCICMYIYIYMTLTLRQFESWRHSTTNYLHSLVLCKQTSCSHILDVPHRPGNQCQTSLWPGLQNLQQPTPLPYMPRIDIAMVGNF